MTTKRSRSTTLRRNDAVESHLGQPNSVAGFGMTSKQWQEESKKLRSIVLDCELGEELKWGHPCYTFQKSNIVLIHGFKEYCALLFFKGALLKDPNGILVQQTPIEVEKAGLKVNLKKTSDFKIPEEFQNKLDNNSGLKKASEALTPGRQRAYIFYFSAPKQSKTIKARIEKYMPQILDGKGLNDL